MSHPEVSISHDAFVATLDQVIERNRSFDEVRLAGLLKRVYLASATNPEVIAIVNQFALECLEGDRT